MSTSIPQLLIFALYALLCLISTVRASNITVVQPLQNQLPPIAQINKHFSWALSPNTFHSKDDQLKYTTSPLPGWLAFDASKLRFSGTPSVRDEGSTEVTVTAHSSSSIASSQVLLRVSKVSPPMVKRPISAQFHAGNPSLSSVFLLSPGSSLATKNPALRIPSQWSFSIGFDYNTFESIGNRDHLYYDVRQATGDKIPDWMVFNKHDITLNGYVPSENELSSPSTLHLVLHASNVEGYSSASLPFDIVIASHELSATAPMPTINVTTTAPFIVGLNSQADFAGIFVDGKSIQAKNISTLTIDISKHEKWLHYDPHTRVLTGGPRPDLANRRLSFPVKLATTFNQHINTTVSMAFVPSFFIREDLPAINVSCKDNLSFNLARFFSNSSFETRGDVDLSMFYEPTNSKDWLRFTDKSILEGVVPDDYPTARVLVTFIAFSHITHSTSHASLPIYVTAPENEERARTGPLHDLRKARHARLILGLALTFGLLGGLILSIGLLIFRQRAAKVKHSTLIDEEGQKAWTEKDRKWHNIDRSSLKTWRNWAALRLRGFVRKSKTPTISPTKQFVKEYGGIGTRLPREDEQDCFDANQTFESTAMHTSVTMRKHEFLTKLKEKVRRVGDRYSPKSNPSSDEIVAIGKPVLVQATSMPLETLPFEHVEYAHFANPFYGPPGLQSYPDSSFNSRSPSLSTAAYSIPRRRADFEKPKAAQQIHEKVLRPASRASDRINQSPTQDSPLVVTLTAEETTVPPLRPSAAPKLPEDMPVTGPTRTPVPSMSPTGPASGFDPPRTTESSTGGRQAAVHKDKTMKVARGENVDGLKESTSEDELRLGLRYLEALRVALQLPSDENERGILDLPASPHDVSNTKPSFPSLFSSNADDSTVLPVEQRVLVVPGQKFRFEVRVPSNMAGRGAPGAKMPHDYNVKIISGEPIEPLQVDLTRVATRGTAEITGQCTRDDIGVVSFGIYARRGDEMCLAKVTIEVAELRK